jgi:hypothetical protein
MLDGRRSPRHGAGRLSRIRHTRTGASWHQRRTRPARGPAPPERADAAADASRGVRPGRLGPERHDRRPYRRTGLPGSASSRHRTVHPRLPRHPRRPPRRTSRRTPPHESRRPSDSPGPPRERTPARCARQPRPPRRHRPPGACSNSPHPARSRARRGQVRPPRAGSADCPASGGHTRASQRSWSSRTDRREPGQVAQGLSAQGCFWPDTPAWPAGKVT